MIKYREVRKEIRLLGSWARDYYPRVRKEVEDVISTSKSVRYSAAKNPTPRGFYCPNPMADIVIGNVSRGRMVEGPCAEGASFEYFFDQEGLLRAINYLEDGEVYSQEINVYSGDDVYGLRYDEDRIESIIHEVYHEGNIIKLTEFYPSFSLPQRFLSASFRA